jgi:hypothetical protein
VTRLEVSMEQIRLPKRVVATRTTVVVGMTVLATVLVLGWVGLILYRDVAARVNMTDFRTVVATGQPVREFRNAELQVEWTLFQEGGRRRSLRPYAERALGMDSWDGAMRYVYAQALWREYNLPEGGPGRTPGGLLREELPGLVITYLRIAIVRDPTNCFYRSTLAGVLRTTGAQNAEAKSEVVRLLLRYPPQDTYGLIRTAEMLAAEGGDKGQVRADYCRGLSFVSAEMTSGLVDTSATESAATGFSPLGPRLVSRAVTGLMRDIGPYDDWVGTLPDAPEARWLIAGELRSRGMNVEAEKEYAKVVELVKGRLALQGTQSVFRMVLELLCPLGNAGGADRFVMNREIGTAATILRTMSRPDEAMELLRVEISRAPADIGARLALGGLLMERAAVWKAAARDFTEKRDAAQAAEADNKAEEMYQEADKQASAILDRQPLSSEALALRARIPRRAPEGTTP